MHVKHVEGLGSDVLFPETCCGDNSDVMTIGLYEEEMISVE